MTHPFPGRAHSRKRWERQREIYDFFPKGKILVSASTIVNVQCGSMGVWGSVMKDWDNKERDIYTIHGVVMSMPEWELIRIELEHGAKSFYTDNLQAGVSICQLFGGVGEVRIGDKKLFDGYYIHDHNPFYLDGVKYCACGDAIEDESKNRCWVCEGLDEVNETIAKNEEQDGKD